MTILFEPSRRDSRPLVDQLDGDVHSVTSLPELVAQLVSSPGELLVVLGPGAPLGDVCAFAADMRVAYPAVGVVLLRRRLDTNILSEAMRAGIREVVRLDDPAELPAACRRSLAVSHKLVRNMPSAEPTEPQTTANVVTVFAAKGGAGKTTAATNLAVALAAGGTKRVCLIDLDLAFGDVAISLQLVPDRSLADAVTMGDRLDESGLRGLLTPYAPGIDTILAPASPTDGEHVTRALIAAVLKVAKGMYDYVVVDTPPYINDQVLAALDASDQFVLLATPDIPSLKSLRVTLDMFDLLSYPKGNRFVVLNRADAKVGLTPADIEGALRVPISAHIPSSREVPISVNQGVPIVAATPAHAVSKAFRDLAMRHLGGVPEPVAEPARKGWTSRFPRPAAVAR